ncbi:hypothetical protein [Pararhizobium sp. IMCC21322]|uniref:hypothetical protein n=1 Tax=Pararhizobium sp. IMCC21322 TaxID=3067903 RepID=UPI0027428DD5|nr:hypothetical protein [Pararhizobium sp. IMCC21322]
MNAPATPQGKRYVRGANRLARTIGFTMLGGAVLVAMTIFIAWDADFFVFRDKWENFKLAMFGEWQPSELTENTSQQTDLLAGVDEISFFKRVTVGGLGVVVTGASFASAEDVIEKRAAKQWCYVGFGKGVATRHIDLGKQAGASRPIYSDLQTVPPDVLSELGISTERLASIAKANCRFGIFDIENPR